MPTFRNTLFHLHWLEPNLFPYHFSFLVHSTHTYLPMKMEQTECSETSAYKLQTPGNYPKESIQHFYLSSPYSLRLAVTKKIIDFNASLFHRIIHVNSIPVYSFPLLTDCPSSALFRSRHYASATFCLDPSLSQSFSLCCTRHRSDSNIFIKTFY